MAVGLPLRRELNEGAFLMNFLETTEAISVSLGVRRDVVLSARREDVEGFWRSCLLSIRGCESTTEGVRRPSWRSSRARVLCSRRSNASTSLFLSISTESIRFRISSTVIKASSSKMWLMLAVDGILYFVGVPKCLEWTGLAGGVS